jgi:hypothetical protein
MFAFKGAIPSADLVFFRDRWKFAAALESPGGEASGSIHEGGRARTTLQFFGGWLVEACRESRSRRADVGRVSVLRRLARIIAITVVLGAAALAVAWIGGRFSDGPLELIPGVPGGPLSGEVERNPAPDWSFARNVDPIEVQINSSPPRSIFTGVVVHGGSLYLPVTLSPLKRWPAVVSRDPRVLVRIEGRLFERQAVPVTDAELLQELIEAGRSKYGPPFHATWAAPFTRYFRLDPLTPSRGK